MRSQAFRQTGNKQEALSDAAKAQGLREIFPVPGDYLKSAEIKRPDPMKKLPSGQKTGRKKQTGKRDILSYKNLSKKMHLRTMVLPR